MYRLFFAVAETKSITAAAHRVALSQPTLSRRITELENHLGVPLLYRTSTGVTLTAEGERLYRDAGALLHSFDDFEREFRLEVGERASLVKISASEGMTRYWLMPRLRKFMNAHPDARFEITSTIETLNLADRDIDLVIRAGDPADINLVGRKAGRLGFGLFGSRDYLASRPSIKRRSDIQNHEIIVRGPAVPRLRGERSGLIPDFLRGDSSNGDRPRIRLEPLNAHYAAAAEGLGLALLPIPFALAEGLIEVLPKDARFALDVWLLRRREGALRKPQRDISRFLDKEFESSKGWLEDGVAG